MIEVNVMIISDRRGPGDWYGWKAFRLQAVPRIGESVSTKSGWTYCVSTVDHDLNDGTISIIITNKRG